MLFSRWWTAKIFALFGKERAVIDKQRSHNGTNKERVAKLDHRQGVSGKPVKSPYGALF